MKVVVLGASGTMGALVSDRLAERGAQVVRAHRGSGVDAFTGTGLTEALAGADVVVDTLNVTTTSAAKAKQFFSAAATNVAQAAGVAGARVVCLSICSAADPEVNRRMGYYQGKAAQEQTYRDLLGDAVTVVRTTQWFELAETLMSQLSVGPLALMPHMVTAPLAAADGAAVIADVALGTAHTGRPEIDVRGPQRLDLVDVARAVTAVEGRRGPIAIRFGGAALRDGRLIPEPADVITETTLEQWLGQR